MADITTGNAYVDTDVGTDDVSHGGSSGTGACKSLVYLWNSRLGTATGDITVNCAGGTVDAYSSPQTLTARSTGTYSVTMLGNLTTGAWDTSKFRMRFTGDGNGLIMAEPNLVINKVQFDYGNVNNGASVIDLSYAGAVAWTVKNSIFRDTAGVGTTHRAVKIASATSGTILFNNDVVYAFNGTSSSGIYCYGAFAVLIYGCTFHNNTVAISDPGGNRNISVKNTAFHTNTSDLDGWQTASCTNNATSKATCDWTGGAFGGTDHGSVTDGDYSFGNLTNHDFSLTDGTSITAVRRQGTTLGGPYATDIKGTTRPGTGEGAYSIGAFEYQTSGPVKLAGYVL